MRERPSGRERGHDRSASRASARETLHKTIHGFVQQQPSPACAGPGRAVWLSVFGLYTLIAAGSFTNMNALLVTSAIIVFLIGLVSEQITQLTYQPSDHVNRS